MKNKCAKDFFEEDLDGFFCDNEFSSEHIINRKKVNVIIDNEVLKERNKKEYDGIVQADLLYFVKKQEIKKPIVGQLQLFDGISYTVFDVKEDLNIYEVILQSNQS